jgi:hypothetical protein
LQQFSVGNNTPLLMCNETQETQLAKHTAELASGRNVKVIHRRVQRTVCFASRVFGLL